ncbi:hypothetical protein DFH07DRAFT_1016513 [Mycena maculata]|uniref:Uncharacterized protein n=1 Tax=Mycena maculata TaxID=230809 RepID=A0AAD7H843_9AGAR|nr:hypothetical protein DFH07DRAFT_1016513 [Mycena maculata]
MQDTLKKSSRWKAHLPTHAPLPLTLVHLAFTPDSDSDSLSSSVGSNSDDTDTSGTSSDDGWSNLLGSDWRESGESSESSDASESEFTSDSDSGDADDEMPDLLPIGYPDSDEEDESSTDDSEPASSESGSEQDGGNVADWGWDTTSNIDIARGNALRRWVQQNVVEMYAQRYEIARNTFPRGPAFMHHVLTELKDTRPDLFREELRISPLKKRECPGLWFGKWVGDPEFVE